MPASVYYRGVPLASLPSSKVFWPLPTRTPHVSIAGGRAFGAPREDVYQMVGGTRTLVAEGSRYHAGIDLYASFGDIIVATEDCEVVNFYHFYRGTYALIVKTATQVINYGECREDSLLTLGHKAPKVNLKPGRTYSSPVDEMTPDAVASITGAGSYVRAGEPVAIVGRMNVGSMLHLEMYKAGSVVNSRWKRSATPASLLDPTEYLGAAMSGKVASDQMSVQALRMIEATSVNSRERTCQ